MIKRAFRRLALLYHPDKDASTINKFQEINEAYSILSNNDKRKDYDILYQKYIEKKNISFPESEIKIKRKKETDKKKEDERKRKIRIKVHLRNQENKRKKKKNIEYATIVLIINFLFVSLIIIDFLLPSEYINDKVIDRYASIKSPLSDIVKTNKLEFLISKRIGGHIINRGSNLKIEISRSLKIVKSFRVKYRTKIYSYNPYFSLYVMFPYILLFVIIFSVLGLISTKSYDSIMGFAISSSLLLMILVLML